MNLDTGDYTLAKHLYIIDTCVLLHDPVAIYKFGENDIYIPLAVIDDLDDIKTRRESVGWSAREFFRQLENFTLQDLLKGVKINDQNGRLFVYNTESPLQKNERPNIVKVHSDNAIIESCLALKAANPRKKVAIITKDTGLRIRAITWGCTAENYKSDQLEDRDFNGIRFVEIDNQEDWDLLWKSAEVLPEQMSDNLSEKISDINPNEFAIFEFGDVKCPAYFKNGKFKIMKDKSNGSARGYSGIQGKNLEQKCALEVLSDTEVPLVTLAGKAGTGKSFLALAAALQMINDDLFDKIVVMKPLIPVGGKDIGALPGDKFDKISAWLGPIKDNIDQILGPRSLSSDNKFEEMVREGIIEVEALTFIQGRSIPRSIIIVDEAENITAREARMVIERCGKDSKVILLGDLSQVENPYLDAKSNGLAHAISGGKKNSLVGSVTLTKVERSELASVASEIFNKPEAQRR